MYVKYKLKHTLLLHVLTLPQEAFIIGSLLVTIAIGGGFWYKNRVHVPLPLFVSYKTSNEKDSIYVRFEMEAFDSIQTNFWKKSTEADVAELFHLALVKTASTTPEKTSLKTSQLFSRHFLKKNEKKQLLTCSSSYSTIFPQLEEIVCFRIKQRLHFETL
jgi:hypothetical protein